MERSKFEKGQFLVAIETDQVERVFIHDGYVTGDGYGVAIGETHDGEIRKSTGYGNWCKGCNVYPADESQIEYLIKKIHNTEQIKCY